MGGTKTRVIAKTLSIAAAAALFATPVAAQKTINLTAIDGYPPKASWVREFIGYYIPEVNKQLAAKGNYKINWNQAWSGQIVKTRHVLEGLQKGLGDIGIVTSVFHAGRVPLQNLTFVTPFVASDADLTGKTMDAMVEKWPQFKAAWAQFNQVYLTIGCVLDSYQMFSKDPVTKVSEFNGMKIAGAGVNLRYLQGVGAAGVPGSLVSFYNKLKTGVVSGSMLWPEAVVQFKIVEVAPYMMQADLGSPCSKAINMNASSWKNLPDEVKDVIAKTAIGYRDKMASEAIKNGAGAVEKFKKAGGKVHVLAPDERKKWAMTMPNIAKDWAEDLEKKGIPGKAILADYMDRMRAAGAPIQRHWDRE